MQYAEQLSKRTDTAKSLRRKGIYEEKSFFQLHIGTAHHRAVAGSRNCLFMVVDLHSPWDAWKKD